jgi:hypothetical protein
MSVETASRLGTAAIFPGAEVESHLRGALLDAVSWNAALNGITLPRTATAQYTASIQIDSLDVVDLLCGVEPIVGFELKDSIVKAGGYQSINEAIGHVMPRIEAAWKKHGNKGAKK